MPKQLHTEWATIGKIVAPFGIRGELKVRSLSDIPDRFAALSAVCLSPDYRRYAIEGVRPYKGEMVVLKLAQIDDATTAETLRDRDLCIPITELAKLPPDSYYQHDIIGLRVLTLTEREVGSISDIIITGSNDVYVITARDGRQVLIPAIKDVVKQIDLVRHVMYIDPIGGLIDDDAVVVEQGEPAREEEE